MNSGLLGLTRAPLELDPGTINGFTDETLNWIGMVRANGGTLSNLSVNLADGISRGFQNNAVNSKIVWIAPMLGNDMLASIVPLRGGAPMTNTGFVNGDFTEATGLKGNGSSKRLDTLIKCSQLGASNSFGLGFWENNIDFGGTDVVPFGCYDAPGGTDNRYLLDLRSDRQAFCGGGTGTAYTSLATTAANAHYYGQRVSSTLREIWKNGTTLLASTTASDSAVGIADTNIHLLAAGAGGFWKGRCALAYMTTGNLTSGEVSTVHTLFNDLLITPLGR